MSPLLRRGDNQICIIEGKMTVWHSIIRLLSSVGVTPKFIFRWKGTAAKPPFPSTPLKVGIVISTVGRNLKSLKN